ncbi:leucine-rich repeat domain, L domain-like protein [Artemisia annua]|uniref:Leucine-rich repeat domain, L domain-like protein n=1 Tax=Artemisia annua TaxID=35608 RepID=A0A2U1KG47_ARTAN|nr:leucine-rich repeat domain, L domain-like protein [Artemisia annua]
MRHEVKLWFDLTLVDQWGPSDHVRVCVLFRFVGGVEDFDSIAVRIQIGVVRLGIVFDLEMSIVTKYLHLHQNRFIGRIPAELGSLQKLRHLDVGDNHLVGTIRELIRIERCFPALRNLHLSRNKMSGIVPFGLAHIPKLTYLYLDHNQFSGRIPDAFYKHPYLKRRRKCRRCCGYK